jgi:hypothetical protein
MKMNMEGFTKPIEKTRPTSEPLEVLGRDERIKQAEINVAGMFNERMGNKDIVGQHIAKGNLGFYGIEDRNF